MLREGKLKSDFIYDVYADIFGINNQAIQPIQNGSVDKYMKLIKFIVNKLAINLPSFIEIDDLISEGVIGAMNGLETYDPAKDVKLDSYLGLKIKGRIIDYLRENDFVPRSSRLKVKYFDEVKQTLEAKLQRPVTPQEVAEKANLSSDEINDIGTVMHLTYLSLEDSVHEEEEDDSTRLKDVIKDDSTCDITKILIDDQMSSTLKEKIKRLNTREQITVSLYYNGGYTLKEIGNILDISESRICQIHADAVEHLQKSLGKGVVEKQLPLYRRISEEQTIALVSDYLYEKQREYIETGNFMRLKNVTKQELYQLMEVTSGAGFPDFIWDLTLNYDGKKIPLQELVSIAELKKKQINMALDELKENPEYYKDGQWLISPHEKYVILRQEYKLDVAEQAIYQRKDNNNTN